MTLSFMRADKWLFSSESVTEGHPDKLCDQVSDAVLDALLAKDPMARVACETATTTGTVLVAGEITTTAYADVIGIVRDVVKDIGYTNAHYGFDYETCGVLTAIKPQSPDIAQGVDRAQDDGGELGAGDQGMMFGFAIDETPELMPLPITLAHAVAKQLAKSRKSGEISYLRPDGKSQITVEYHNGAPKRVHTVVVATQHDDGIDIEQIRRDVKEAVVRAAIPAHLLDNETRYVINGTGKFVIGGPMGDAGLTGRKII
ncbi:MAG TPA: methionine adenosyltransferase, partial [Chloroflexi bacterium]|nr:methionine adenosyltransferase [Chloroflexota bacterium]